MLAQVELPALPVGYEGNSVLWFLFGLGVVWLILNQGVPMIQALRAKAAGEVTPAEQATANAGALAELHNKLDQLLAHATEQHAETGRQFEDLDRRVGEAKASVDDLATKVDRVDRQMVRVGAAIAAGRGGRLPGETSL